MAMQIHEFISESRVNGPGRRAVLWFQGCSLGCLGCWNPQTHAFDEKSEQQQQSVEEVASWILLCRDIEGVTFSGGEPLQQAPALLELCKYLKRYQSRLSLGIFGGYTIKELAAGRWQYRCRQDKLWHPGTADLFSQIAAHLDFGVFGRFARAQASSDKPLCGSRNQQVVFFTDRYSERDLETQSCEINLSLDGRAMTVTGFPPPDLVRSLFAQ
jgi:anaerobic ribonucleoside-triphosphate reductase activating protein